MKIEYTGASLKQVGGHDDAGSADKWDSGGVMCGVCPGSQATFTVTAEDGSTLDYTIAITQPNVSGEPVLSNGNATRTSDKEATVTFTSSATGSYYYKVVASGAAEPDIDTSKSGSAAVAGSNTITLNNLTAGARDIYIVVKNAAGDVSNKLKIAIPAFGEDPDKPDEGDFTITYTGPTGGKLVPSRTRANAGDTITVSYKIVEGNKERVQSFRGVVIQIKGSGKTKMFTIRKISNGVGVERIFPLYSPHIDKIEVNKIGVVRRARIYYLRDLTGKKARIKEKRMTRTEKK